MNALVQALGWTLLHFVWQGLLIAGLSTAIASCTCLAVAAPSGHRACSRSSSAAVGFGIAGGLAMVCACVKFDGVRLNVVDRNVYLNLRQG